MKINILVMVLFLLQMFVPVTGLASTTGHTVDIQAATQHVSTQQGESYDTFIIAESPYGFAETVKQLKLAIVANNFRFIREQTVDYGFVSEAMSSDNEVILYFCNFALLDEALQLEKRVGVFLPCRITIIQEGDTVKMIALNPKRLKEALFPSLALGRMCETMHDVYQHVLDEAAL